MERIEFTSGRFQTETSPVRIVKAVHGLKDITPDPDFEVGLANHLKAQYELAGLVELYGRYCTGEGELDRLMRRVICRAVARGFGHGVRIEAGVRFKHLETIEFGNSVFVGADTFIQGRYDGRCVLGNHVWIGPHSYFDARDLILEDYVGWGPGAKILGSQHTGFPVDVPIIQTDLEIKPVRICAWADIGTNAVILPGVTVGRGSMVGAGAVVRQDVPEFAVVAGIPARFLRWRAEKSDVQVSELVGASREQELTERRENAA
jgi:acetyltransferase-like isoleucine patch superfamily enzyme